MIKIICDGSDLQSTLKKVGGLSETVAPLEQKINLLVALSGLLDYMSCVTSSRYKIEDKILLLLDSIFEDLK